MPSFETLEQLDQIFTASEPEQRPRQVLVCSTGCRAKGAAQIASSFRESIEQRSLGATVSVIDTGCHGQCSRAPLVMIEPGSVLYGPVSVGDVDEIISETVVADKIIPRLCAQVDGDILSQRQDVPFYRSQQRDVLTHCGLVDPKSIDDALAAGTYRAMALALKMSPDDVIGLVSDSGLRGRGGGGFPTGRKWSFARAAAGTEKYLVCNADEGDPGAFMDRALLEGTPHQILEGMIIGAWAIGASHGFIYVRAEYPIAVEHVTLAIQQARDAGLLGDDILGTGFCFDIEVRKGAGAFVCGEETALIASLQGDRGLPRARPPYPAIKGFRDQPTTINNVETLANVPLIITRGADAYRKIGVEGSTGTKIFALAGKVQETGLVEVPMGTTLRKIVFDIGGGVPDGRPFKAAQIGGPSGGCLPAECLDLQLDYESVKQAGAIVGSGGLVVMDDHTCMVDVARFFLEFTQKESCGKCTPCRVGTRHLADILKRICDGDGVRADLDRLERLANDVKSGSLCGLGQTAPNPILTTLRYFKDEYLAHVVDKRCPAGVCTGLISFRITPEECIGCGKCAKACPADVITGVLKEPYVIDQSGCIRCGACADVCPVDAVVVS